ncbi:MAG TPA: flagellar basal body-associated FliL family protein [Steroidobacteraceae bacterium]|nr:flagellar basal body-associated FliL family protein [Steroidobacteraceae bacterium]
MADAADEAIAPPAKPSGGLMSTLSNAASVFLMALLAVIVGGFINAKLHPMPDLKMGKDGLITAVVPAPAAGGKQESGPKNTLFLPLDPPFVVNFEEGSAVRFLQITMEVMAHDQKVIDGVQKNLPLIRNNLLLLMSNRDFQVLMTREGKEKLRAEAVAEVNAVQKKQGGGDIDDLLFTSFVVQ